MSSHKLRENGQTCRENQALSDQSVPLHLSISIFLCTFQREGISLIWISIITNHTRDSTVFLWTIQFTSQVLIPVWRRANARNVNFVTIYGSQFTLSTQLIKLNYPLTIIAPLSKSSRFFWILKNDRSLIISKTESCIMGYPHLVYKIWTCSQSRQNRSSTFNIAVCKASWKNSWT